MLYQRVFPVTSLFTVEEQEDMLGHVTRDAVSQRRCRKAISAVRS